MSRWMRWSIGLLALALLFGGSFALLRAGIYGLTVFILFPVILGGIAEWLFPQSSSAGAAGLGAVTIVAATFSLVFIKQEGFFCVLMVLPLAVPLGAIGGWIAYRLGTSRTAAHGLTAILLVPGTLIWDINAQPPVYEVRTAITVAAAPEKVWKYVVAFSELPEPKEWLFRVGVAYPIRARIEGARPGAVRYCEFSTGAFVEPIEIWDDPRLLRFRVTASPAPMREWTPYGPIVTKHLHGYLLSEKGEFRLRLLGPGQTLLEGVTWYRHGLWPASYWRLWSDAIIHRIHWRVLSHIKTLAES